jgi:Cytochrome P450
LRGRLIGFLWGCLFVCTSGSPVHYAYATNNVFAGRNDSYLSLVQKFSQDVPLAGFILRQIPPVLRPILAPLITLPNKYHIHKVQHHLFPEIQSRISHLDPEKEGSHSQPNDFLQWSVKNALTRLADKPEEMSPRMIAGRLLAINFAAIHTSTFSITNAIFDLASSKPSEHYFEQLREEAAVVLAEDNGIWTKRGLSKMHKIDSALRESLRLRSFLSLGMVRKIVAKGGVTTPEGTHLRRGISIAIPTYGIHNDENNYSNPAKYDALRYARQMDLIDAADEQRDDNHLRKANLSMVSTSPEYQPFGHGRHACPGRFFAANELKLLLAYAVLNYEIEPLAVRPAGHWIAMAILPPMKATIQVRRRKDT